MSDKEFLYRYPGHKYEDRDVVLLELDKAYGIANSQYKYLQYIIGILLTLATLLATKVTSFDKLHTTNALVFGLFLAFSYSILRYVAELQKSIVLNSRKVVILREMLGLNYGSQGLVLPMWRIEGANRPFVIKMFPGWGLRYTHALPFWIFVSFGSSLIYYSMTNYQVIFITIYILVLAITFRHSLFDTYENFRLLFAQRFAKLIRIGLIKNFEEIIYQAKLAVAEANRIHLDFEQTKSVLIAIEDSSFYKHNGINWKSILRGLLSMNRGLRKKFNISRSGASTIHMQLIRTLFITEYDKPLRRKIIELILAKWLHDKFTEQEILNLYLVSVRFETNINGIAAAAKYFLDSKRKNKKLTTEESLFLIERISNISSDYNIQRLHYLLNSLPQNITISSQKTLDIYRNCERKGLIHIKH